MTTEWIDGHEMRTDRAMISEVFGGPFKVMSPSIGEHHLKDGITFLRYDKDHILIRRWTKEADGWHFRSTMVSNAEWRTVADYLAVT